MAFTTGKLLFKSVEEDPPVHTLNNWPVNCTEEFWNALPAPNSRTFYDFSDTDPLFFARKVYADPNIPDEVYPELRLMEFQELLGPTLESVRDIFQENLDTIWWQEEDPMGLWGVGFCDFQEHPECEERLVLDIYRVSRPSSGLGLFSVPKNQFFVAKEYTWILEDYTCGPEALET